MFDRLQALPEELFAGLREVAYDADPEAANAVIQQISGHDELLANALTGLVEHFRFDILQHVLKEAPS